MATANDHRSDRRQKSFRRSKLPNGLCFCRIEQLIQDRYVKDDLVTILVGKEKVAFHVHRSLLVKKSVYFATRLKDCWDGKKDEPLEMTHVDVNGFEVVVDFLYNNALPERITDHDDLNDMNPVLKAYKAADQLAMFQLQNALVDSNVSQFRKLQRYWELHGILDVHKFGLQHTPLYKLMLQSCVEELGKRLHKGVRDKQLSLLAKHPEAVLDVVKCMSEFIDKPWKEPYNQPYCRYHIHEDNQKCDPGSN